MDDTDVTPAVNLSCATLTSSQLLKRKYSKRVCDAEEGSAQGNRCLMRLPHDGDQGCGGIHGRKAGPCALTLTPLSAMCY